MVAKKSTEFGRGKNPDGEREGERESEQSKKRKRTDLNYSMQIEKCSSRYTASVFDGDFIIHSDIRILFSGVESTFAYELVCSNLCWPLKTDSETQIYPCVYFSAEGHAMVPVTETAIKRRDRIISAEDAMNYQKGQAIDSASTDMDRQQTILFGRGATKSRSSRAMVTAQMGGRCRMIMM